MMDTLQRCLDENKKVNPVKRVHRDKCDVEGHYRMVNGERMWIYTHERKDHSFLTKCL